MQQFKRGSSYNIIEDVGQELKSSPGWWESGPADRKVAVSIPWSGHVPRLQVWSLVRAHTGSNQLTFFSHTDVSVSLPSSLSKINEEIMSLGEGKMG